MIKSGFSRGGDQELTHCGEITSSLAYKDLHVTADVRGFHTVAAEAVPVFLNLLKLQDFKTWEIQGRKRFHFDVFSFNIPRCQPSLTEKKLQPN